MAAYYNLNTVIPIFPVIQALIICCIVSVIVIIEF